MANNRDLDGFQRPIQEGVLDTPNSFVYSPDGSKVESATFDEAGFTITEGVITPTSPVPDPATGVEGDVITVNGDAEYELAAPAVPTPSTSGQIVKITCDALDIDVDDGVTGYLDNLTITSPTTGFSDADQVWCVNTPTFTNRITLLPGTYIISCDAGVTAVGYTFDGEETVIAPSATGSGSTQPYLFARDVTTEIYGLDPAGWITESIWSVPEGTTTRDKVRFTASIEAPLTPPYPADSILFATISIVRL